jgi:hypothetical protein
MKLRSRFLQLPLLCDAERLAAEVGALEEAAWLPHPQNFAGNDFLPLVSVNGNPREESFKGPMRPTPHMQRCPYLVDVVASLGASVGRTRLMRLTGHAEVSPHYDAHYYWRERMRVHVPIVTQPTVRFICGPDEINMKAGELWIFDTWELHRVINDAVQSRIHLVVDTVGGEGFWPLAMNGRNPSQASTAPWTPRRIAPQGVPASALDFETANVPTVMTPWEVREHIDFLLSEGDPRHPAFEATSLAAARFIHTWRGLWSTFGESSEGWPRYRAALDGFIEALRREGATAIVLRNGCSFAAAVAAQVYNVALADRAQDDGAGERRGHETGKVGAM